MQVSCGGLHTLALSKDHKVYCWGSIEGGQLGIPFQLISKLVGNAENAVKIPQLIESLTSKQVVQVACGESHSLCLCKDYSVFGWGSSCYG
jgi:alpha-tubulin suppressor-like RCC1 family protein